MAPPGQWREGVRAPRLGREHRIEACTLGLLDELTDTLRGLRSPVAELES